MLKQGYDLRAIDGALGVQSRRFYKRTVLPSGGTFVLDTRSEGIDVTLTENATLVFSGPTQDQYHEIEVILRQDTTGTWTITWPSTITWAGGSVPVPSTAASTIFSVRLVTTDGGATWFGVAPAVNSDTIWDAAGDLVVGTGADTAVRLPVGTSAGQALAADPGATNKLSWNYPLSIREAVSGSTSSFASTWDRRVEIETNNTAILSTGRISCVSIFLPKGLTINNISFWSMTTALSVGVNQWFGIFDLSRNKLAVTADDTSTAWAANTKKTLVISGGYVITASAWYYLGIMVKATTVPTLAGLGSASANNYYGAAPLPAMVNDTGLTNPASCPSQLAAGAVQNMWYGEVS